MIIDMVMNSSEKCYVSQKRLAKSIENTKVISGHKILHDPEGHRGDGPEVKNLPMGELKTEDIEYFLMWDIPKIKTPI